MHSGHRYFGNSPNSAFFVPLACVLSILVCFPGVECVELVRALVFSSAGTLFKDIPVTEQRRGPWVPLKGEK